MLQADVLIQENESVKDALKKLNKTGTKVLLVVDNDNRLLGTITDGDIRRYILQGKGVEDDIKEVYNKRPISIKKTEFSIELAKEVLLKHKIELVPIIDKEKKVVEFATLDQIFSKLEVEALRKGRIDIPVVIMAGGKGTRLEPFTKILPKPLIPISDKPIIEIIIDEFKRYGIRRYYVTLNHKGDMIVSYFNSIKKKGYKIKYIREDASSGTAGSLKLLEGYIDSTFIVSNCDVIVKADFEDVVNFHKEQKALLTILSPILHYKIPYGVLKFKGGGEVESILEKPEYTFTTSAGVYILDKQALQFIPKDSHFDMTDLINILIKNKKKVVVYPVNEKDYIDIGQWEEYKNAVNKLQSLV